MTHHAVEHRVGERDNRHPLMMRHEISNDRDMAARGKPRRRVVERFVEAIPTLAASGFQGLEIAHRQMRLNHRGECRRIRCDDNVVAKPALKTQPGYAEIGVLIGQLEITCVKGGFGNPPRRPELEAIFDLPRDDAAFGALQQATGRRAHDQRRHQIFKH